MLPKSLDIDVSLKKNFYKIFQSFLNGDSVCFGIFNLRF